MCWSCYTPIIALCVASQKHPTNSCIVHVCWLVYVPNYSPACTPCRMLRQDALVAALAPHKNVRVLRLRHTMELFAGWDDDVLKTSFDAFVWNITANWCCRDVPYIKKGLPGKVKMVIQW